MNELTIRQIRREASATKIAEWTEGGNSCIITSRGKPVGLLFPFKDIDDDTCVWKMIAKSYFNCSAAIKEAK